MNWLEFIVYMGLIFAAGTVLCRDGDVLAEKSGMGRTWIGVILLATVTSLPELFSSVSAVKFTNAPNLAIGSLMGSCVFNLLLLAVVDIIYREDSLYYRASKAHVLSATLGLAFIAFVALNIMISALGIAPSIGSFALSSVVIILFYPFAVHALFVYEKRMAQEDAEEDEKKYKHITLRRAAIGFGLASVVVVLAAIRLPFVGEKIAQQMGWNQSFVGSIFIAFATSAPELVVTISAVRMGAIDLAIGNVLGSNLFNMWVVGIIDPFYTQGSVLGSVSTLHVISAMTAIIMSGLVIAGLTFRPMGRVLKSIGWISLILIVLFAANSYILYIAQE